MTVTYAETFLMYGNELKVAQKIKAQIDHATLSTDPTFSPRLVRAAYDDAEDDEAAAEVIALNQLISKETTLRGLYIGQRGSLESGFFITLDNDIDIITEDDRTAGAIEYVYDDALLASGQVKIIDRLGILGALRRQMKADSETVKENVVAFPNGLVADPDNEGVVDIAGAILAGESHLLSGTLVFSVTSEFIDAIEMEVSLELDTPLPDGVTVVTADNPLRIGKSYEDGPTGFSGIVDFDAPVEVDPDGIFSNVAFVNPTDADTDKGKAFFSVFRQTGSPEWLIKWFRLSSRNASELVQSTTVSGVTGFASGTSLTGPSGMQISFDFSKAAANTAMGSPGDKRENINFNLKAPRIGDRFTAPVTNDKAGNFSTKIAEMHRISLETAPSTSETISDALAASVPVT